MGGFTLIEMLVVIIVIGVLFAIAAPGWDTILSRQRVSAAREQIVQTLRVAQSSARSTRAPRAVVFDMSAPSKPRIANVPFIPSNSEDVSNRDTVGIVSSSNAWTLLGNGNVNVGTLKLAVNGTTSNPASSFPSLIFDGNGAIAMPPLVPSAQLTNSSVYVITVSRGNATGTATNRCVIVATILGAIRTEDGPYNASTGRGCP
jgi:prepilin-type N-terminal cleavage/methylation domain-containing protein